MKAFDIKKIIEDDQKMAGTLSQWVIYGAKQEDIEHVQDAMKAIMVPTISQDDASDKHLLLTAEQFKCLWSLYTIGMAVIRSTAGEEIIKRMDMQEDE